jgi:hypothetical protein
MKERDCGGEIKRLIQKGEGEMMGCELKKRE